MILRLCAVLAPLVLCAQQAPVVSKPTPPADVDEALRARVKEYFEYNVAGAFRKVETMVAEDSKDHYFVMPKVQLKSYQIVDITYSDDFTKAVVNATAERVWMLHGQPTVVAMPYPTSWKIENEKWFWYFDPNAVYATPMSERPGLPGGSSATSPGQPPKPVDLSPGAIAATGTAIMAQAGLCKLDKSEIPLVADKPFDGQVTLHNGTVGAVQLTLVAPPVKGLKVALDKTEVAKGGDALLKIHFDPSDQTPAAPGTWIPKGTIKLTIMTEPFGQQLVVALNFPEPHAQ